ncbi:serine/threonine-protein kinase chk-2 [Hyalella azteca]|uniref:Serine/threonine-protein kinase chk-2 n=1 Tax=Hyalella azteca TaxID=294128 RepID=A0A8B7NLY8_HYAAZ|nr:serine/threonine-protein kinase chk-2 [Hyalella azteca]
MTLDWQQYELLCTLGEGRYGIVTRARHKKLGSFVALKTIIGLELFKNKDLPLVSSKVQTVDNTKHSLENSLRHEARVLAALSHPCVVSLVEVCIGQDGRLALALEDLGGTSLSSLVQSRSGVGLCECLVGCVALHMTRALEYLHSRKFLHRDVKPENIMVEKTNHCFPHAKLIDLGLSIKYEADNPPNSSVTRAGTVAFMAPELMSPNVFYGPKVDVFGLGASLYFSLTAEEPFVAYDTPSGFRTSTCVFGLQVQHDENLNRMSMEVSEVIKGVLEVQPHQRWSTNAIMKSHWLRHIAVSRTSARHVSTCLEPLNDWLLLNQSFPVAASYCQTTPCRIRNISEQSTASEEESLSSSLSSVQLSPSSESEEISPNCNFVPPAPPPQNELDNKKNSKFDDFQCLSDLSDKFLPPCNREGYLAESVDCLMLSSEPECRIVGRKDVVCRSLSSSECACFGLDLDFDEETLEELARLLGDECVCVKTTIQTRPWGEVAGMYNLLRLRKISLFGGQNPAKACGPDKSALMRRNSL